MMKSAFAFKTLSAAALALMAGSAAAHVGYGTALYDQATDTYAPAGSAGFDPTVTSNAGWIAGQANNGVNRTAFVDTLADTHNTRARWFSLTQESLVSFTITGTANANGASILNPGFSLYRGTTPISSSHDGAGDQNDLSADVIAAQNGNAAFQAYLAARAPFAVWSPFYDANDEIAAAGGGAPDAGGPNWGVFNGSDDFTLANNAGQLNTWDYISSAGDGHGDDALDNQISFSGTLGPGVYAIFIGGSSLSELGALFTEVQQGTPNGNFSNAAEVNGTNYGAAYAALRQARNAHIDFAVAAAAPVPVPAAVWLFGSALAGMGVISRRKSAA
ncbi:VPLPA-CTERM sorting domain-containing protein [Methylococcus sp. EFPC2]|uniref:VPLPA-CTERM sorting domain-containing protein n=1 Tax=Methylococcus sp. EFPC2 TaxID=2812648 RepID=UPI00196713BE|nr:VPLPA-CTERM sorting domain-containing protein [Methylococcus sp. EFPC2]QSA97037.1 VPLPA-CTERM sorting domain-containing protein [Methylococcus sp. EFPC2]